MKLFILFFILMPVAFAVNCDLSNPYCVEIQDSSLNDSEKDYLIGSLVHEKINFPNHEFVYNHNIDIKAEDIKDKVTKHDSEYIKNAFVKLVAVMPSVIEDNILYANKGKIYSVFDHEIELPIETSPGDCRSEYYIKNHYSDIKSYSDDDYLGSGSLVDFLINQDSNLNVKYSIYLSIGIDHYKTRRYCCSHGKYGCKRYCRKCEYSYTETKNDNLVLEDEKKVNYYDLDLNASFNVINQYDETTKGILNTSNFTSLEFKFSDSYYNEFNYFYTLIFDELDIAVLKSEKYSVESSNNLIKNNEFLVKNTRDCIITLYDHFKKKEFDCSLDFNRLDIYLETDKLTYFENDTIYVDLFSKNITFNLIYDNKTFIVEDKFELKAVPFQNKIRIIYNDLQYEKNIYVKEREKWNFLFNLFIFVGANFSILKVLKGVCRKIWNAD